MARRETGCKPQVTAGSTKRSGPPQRPKPKIKAAAASETTTSETTAAETMSSETATVSKAPEIEAAPHAEPRANDTVTRPRIRGPPPPTAVFSIANFCLAHGISEAFYFKLRDQGQGPREMRLGARVLITHESAARWRLERESATVAAE
jgi:hypothetical protein